jgi:hypothetical protein
MTAVRTKPGRKLRKFDHILTRYSLWINRSTWIYYSTHHMTYFHVIICKFLYGLSGR